MSQAIVPGVTGLPVSVSTIRTRVNPSMGTRKAQIPNEPTVITRFCKGTSNQWERIEEKSVPVTIDIHRAWLHLGYKTRGSAYTPNLDRKHV